MARVPIQYIPGSSFHVTSSEKPPLVASYGTVPSPPPETISHCPVDFLHSSYRYVTLSHSFMSFRGYFLSPFHFLEFKFLQEQAPRIDNFSLNTFWEMTDPTP